MDDFSQHPQSVQEIRSFRSRNGADWTPRDALIELLRQIDKGEADPNALVICWGEVDPKDPTAGYTTFSSACPNGIVALGLLTRCVYRINVQMHRVAE
jgi:hypothetical protein